ncbi:MAG: hypothetical protein V3S41_08730 [Spirochaetia bacterium]
MDLPRASSLLRTPILLDTRNVLDPADARSAGFVYSGTRASPYVQSHLTGWMEQLGLRPQPDPVTNTQLLERVVRVEEELKAQREIMITKFGASDARINDLRQSIGTVKWFIVTSFVVIGAVVSLISLLR